MSLYRNAKAEEKCRKDCVADLALLHSVGKIVISQQGSKKISNDLVRMSACGLDPAGRSHKSTQMGYTGTRNFRKMHKRLQMLKVHDLPALDYFLQYEENDTKAAKNTLKTLKSRNIYSTDMESIIMRLNDDITMLFTNMLSNNLLLKEYFEKELFELSEDDWLMGIELTAVNEDNECLQKSFLQTYWPKIKNNITALYENVILVHFVNVAMNDINTSLLGEGHTLLSDDSKLKKKIESLRSENEKLKAINSKLSKELKGKNVKETDRSSDAVKKEYEKKISKLNKCSSAMQAEINSLKKEIEKKDERIKELEAEKKEEKKKEEEKASESELIENVAEITEDLPELPETGVIMVGGHIGQVNKMKKIYPGWKYYDGNSSLANINFGQDIKLMIVRYDHMSHSLLAKTKKYSNRVPVIYTDATGVERLVRTIKEEYAKIICSERQSA